MKVKPNKRPRQIRGMLACRCCDNLYDRNYKIDKQVAKEIEEDIKDLYGGCSVMGTREAVNFAYRDRNPLSPQIRET